MDYSELIILYKHVSNFQWSWRYSCLNVKHKKTYKTFEGKTNDVQIAFIDYVNDLNKLQQFKGSVQKSNHRIQCTFQPSWQHICSCPEVVLAFLLYEGSTIHTASDQFVSCVYFFLQNSLFIHPHRQKSNLYAPSSNSCIFTPTENWTHVYMHLFTRNSP